MFAGFTSLAGCSATQGAGVLGVRRWSDGGPDQHRLRNYSRANFDIAPRGFRLQSRFAAACFQARVI